MEAPPRFELGNEAFAELCLTTWLWCRIYYIDCASALCYSTPLAFCCRLERETRYSLPAAHSCKALSAAAKACPADCAELAMRQMSRALSYHFNAVCVLLLVGAREEIFAACCSLLQGFDRYRESLSCGLRRTRHAANVARLAVSLQRRLRFVVGWSERRDIRYLLLTLARLCSLPRKLVLRTAPNSPCGKCRAPCCITLTPFAFCC